VRSSVTLQLCQVKGTFCGRSSQNWTGPLGIILWDDVSGDLLPVHGNRFSLLFVNPGLTPLGNQTK